MIKAKQTIKYEYNSLKLCWPLRYAVDVLEDFKWPVRFTQYVTRYQPDYSIYTHNLYGFSSDIDFYADDRILKSEIGRATNPSMCPIFRRADRV